MRQQRRQAAERIERPAAVKAAVCVERGAWSVERGACSVEGARVGFWCAAEQGGGEQCPGWQGYNPKLSARLLPGPWQGRRGSVALKGPHASAEG